MNVPSKIALSFILAALAGQPAAAQEVNLRSQDGAIDLVGTFVGFEDGIYIIRTQLGSIRMSAERVDCFGAACPADATPVAPKSTAITLQSRDGAISISGNLLSFENDQYLLDTSVGKLAVNSLDAICLGEGCPTSRLEQTSFKIASAGGLSGGLLTSLLEGFATTNGKSVDVEGRGTRRASFTLQKDGDTPTKVGVLSQTSSIAVRGLLDGQADLAAVTRPVRVDERNALIGENADDIARSEAETVLALDALAIVVSPDNPVRAIAQENLARVFSGEITDWAQLGGNPGAIKLYVRETDSGTGTVFSDLVMTPARAEVAANATILESDAAVSNAVLQDPQAIGFTSFSALEKAKSLAIRGECGIQTPLNDFTIKTEEYPLSRRIYMYRPTTSIPQDASDFLRFIRSNGAQEIVQSAGFVGQDLTWKSVNEQGLRFVSTVLPTEADVTFTEIQDMLDELVAADRLSLTFRFNAGSARLDTRAQADIGRLAELIDNGFFDGKEIIVAGFTDSIGLGEINQQLSQARAQQVIDTVKAASRKAENVPMRAIGYGEMTPLGCNETAVGRQVNRRVEIWMKDVVG